MSESGPKSEGGGGERIAKVIARAGLCSRREAERLIEAGRVTVNGSRITSPALNVGTGDSISVDGAALPAAEPARLWRLHKPAGVLTASRDPEGRRTIYDLLPSDLPRVMPIGRLDLNSEGLLLLTNDGGLKRRLELPSTGWRRRYRVRVHGHPDEKTLAALAAGVTVEGVAYGAIEARIESQRGDNAWLGMTLTEGKNREIRRVCEHLGLQVNRLIRVAYGPFQLGQLAKRAVAEVRGKVLRDQLGRAGLADLLGDAPAKRAAGPKVGTARAKPRPVKPGHRKLAKYRKETAEKAGTERGAGPAKRAGASGQARSTKSQPGKAPAKRPAKGTAKRTDRHANRRRPS